MLKEEFLKLLKEDADFRRQVEEILGISTLDDIKDMLKRLLNQLIS